MAFKIIRNDITKMNTEAIVNTANEFVSVGSGCDSAVYNAAGFDELLAYRREKIGEVPEGDVFITPGFQLPAKYIIHAVSPCYMGGEDGKEEKLRSCYRKSLQLAKEQGIRSISFPLISTGSFGYPKEEGMRIAVDEINAFLLTNEMEICLVVFDDTSNDLGKRIYPGLEEFIDRNYVEKKEYEEYIPEDYEVTEESCEVFSSRSDRSRSGRSPRRRILGSAAFFGAASFAKAESCAKAESICDEASFETEHESKLDERMKHLSDTFSQYLLFLIQDKGMENAEVYKRAIVDKKIFSKIKNNPDYHPQKLTALCLCVGAKLNLDESKDLLARAGYALSPCDKTDIIFSYFIENKIYDMIELDIQLEEHGLPCIIS